MSAPRFEPAEVAPSVPPRDAGLVGLRSRVWTALPALVVSGTVVSLAAAPLVILGSGMGVVSLLWLGLVVAPIYGGLLAQTVDVVLGEEPAPWSFGRYLRIGWRAGLWAGLVPALTGCVFVISWRWWQVRGDVLALAPLTASGLVSTLGLLCAIVAPAIARRRSQLRGWPLVLFSLHVVARRPVPVLAVLASVVIIVGAAIQWTASLLVLLPVPLALVSVLAAWRTAAVSSEWESEGGTPHSQ